MTCMELEAVLCDYIDGALDKERLTAVEKHLAECTTCANLARDAAAAVAFLEKAPPAEPPAELVTRLLYQAPVLTATRRNQRSHGFLVGWLQPLLQPRFAMGMAMTILSLSLLGKFIGLPDRPLRPADLNPVRVIETVEDRFHRAWDRVLKYYDSLRVVYEIQNRLSEWTAQEGTAQPEENAAPGPDAPGQARQERTRNSGERSGER